MSNRVIVDTVSDFIRVLRLSGMSAALSRVRSDPRVMAGLLLQIGELDSTGRVNSFANFLAEYPDCSGVSLQAMACEISFRVALEDALESYTIIGQMAAILAAGVSNG